MEITPQTDATLTLPLPLYKTAVLANAVSRDGGKFSVLAGLDEGLVAQLKKYSLDDTDTELHITSDRKRFGEGSYEEWYAKGRTPFALVHQDSGALAALVWLGPKPLGRKPAKKLSAEEQKEEEKNINSENWHTISYRAYKPYRGKGLMKPFTRFAMETYLKSFPGGKVWAGVDTSNAASDALAASLGFVALPEASDPENHWLVLVRE